MNTLCGYEVGFLNVKPDRAESNYCTLQD